MMSDTDDQASGGPKEFRLKNWQDFEESLQRELSRAASLADSEGTFKPKFLFRGQGNATWKLTTTLERRIPPDAWPMSFENYYTLAFPAKYELAAHTGQKWDICNRVEYREWLPEWQNPDLNFKEYGYFVYLRHLGFPSPLLDWTASPYIAAFFAFENPPPDAEFVAIYAFADRLTRMKAGSLTQPSIHTFGPYVDSHKRHFLQQCHYTIAQALDPQRGWRYQFHELALAGAIENQDVSWKFEIPTGERRSVLENLNRYNINSFSLFGGDDALAKTLAMRIFDFRNWRAL
jgi:hypothetical protein